VSPFGMNDHDWNGLETETVGLLSALLRADTSNPPGNETACALVLRDYLARNGVPCDLVGPYPERLNLVARVHGGRPGPALLFLGHTDVVPAEADEWTEPPFSGAVKGGYVWGRGALDMKCQVAAEAVAVARAARNGAHFAGELVLAATADEERGDYCGARWLIQNRPDLARCDYVVNEGGGTWVPTRDRRLFTYTVGEKGYADFRIYTRGRGGHGSVPLHERNAVEVLGRAITLLAECDLPVDITPLTARYVDALVGDGDLGRRLKDPGLARSAVRTMLQTGDDRGYLIEPLLGITFSPTFARAGGEAINVIPSRAELRVDCRILPGHRADEVEREVRAALAPLGDACEFVWGDVTMGNESPHDTTLAASLVRVLTAMVPDADVVPSHLCGFTDSRWFRAGVPGVVAYGFCPFLAEDSAAMGGREHAKDERVAIADLPFQALFYGRLVADLLS
jgi:acetylornithine deacetylase/succinyl-diaminopimelate desuccinylase-like protein